MMKRPNFLSSIFGNENQKVLNRILPLVAQINALEETIKPLSDEEIKQRISAIRLEARGSKKLDAFLPEVFALTREAAWRVLEQRPFDVQLIGGIVLHQGNIAEMKTGEGKTLAAVLPAALNALGGANVHIITVNDYLAQRDSEWMGHIFQFLGLSVGCITNDIDDETRQKAYQADITYGTNNEFGFDYLRDNMKFTKEDMVQRGHHFAIIDEVDSILIDEARTPLVISGPLEDKTDLYVKMDKLIPHFVDEDFEIDEKQRSITLTETGNSHAEELLTQENLMEGESLYDAENVAALHHINQALRAHKLFTRDRDYIVRNNKVVIIDEFTGRMMAGRRYSDGLHQALEAKENTPIEDENQTLASITFQNYFRMYSKLSGMTGTAMTEREEFLDIYGLDVISIPTNVDIQRLDEDDEVYLTEQEKYTAIIEKIAACHAQKQPVLVGTVSIQKSEVLSDLLKQKNIPHSVLNARYHEQEAQIISEAGAPAAVTIATNMAGRGTDIKLGGTLEPVEEKQAQVIEAGGLFVLGTERHESRRIDNQLRGRSGRQGDPGGSQFYLSLDDDLMRIFGSDKMAGMLQKLGLKEGEAIVHPWVNKALEKAQKKVEGRNFDLRKNLLKFDNVMNDQRSVVFEQRSTIIASENVSDIINPMREEIIDELLDEHIPEKSWVEEWNTEGLEEKCSKLLGLHLPIASWSKEEGITDEIIHQRITEAAKEHLNKKFAAAPPDVLPQIEKAILLRALDGLWREHLQRLEYLRQIVGLRGFGQRDPLNEYKSESFELFENFLHDLRKNVTEQMMTLELMEQEPLEEKLPEMEMHHEDSLALTLAGNEPPLAQTAPRAATPAIKSDKIPRNALCFCGSGKKYKHCCGK
jgi:preprotein translocase subunit SecA